MKTVIIYSGGLDSFTLLNQLHEYGHQLKALTFNYGQRHSKEISYAIDVCFDLEIPHSVVDMKSVGELFNSSLTQNDPVPEGHYAEEKMKSTVVPARNMMMLSIAIGHAASLKYDRVAIGVHGGDHHIYPDCRPGFISMMNNVSRIADYHSVDVIAPFISKTKGEIVGVGKNLNLDYKKAWTCYNGQMKPCGKCGACVERAEAFQENNMTDPLI